MALIRGQNSDFPCPVCLVPNECQHDLSTKYDMRSADSMKTVYENADDLNAKEGEELLKSFGLRAVEVMCLISNSVTALIFNLELCFRMCFG